MGKIGHDAQVALPLLEARRDDENPLVALSAAHAIKAILEGENPE